LRWNFEPIALLSSEDCNTLNKPDACLPNLISQVLALPMAGSLNLYSSKDKSSIRLLRNHASKKREE
jgi:hypothetical protein